MNYNHEFDVDEWYRELAESQRRSRRRECIVWTILGIVFFVLVAAAVYCLLPVSCIVLQCALC